MQVLVPDLITKIREDCATHQRVPTKLSVHWRLKGSGYGNCRPGASAALPQVYMIPTLQLISVKYPSVSLKSVSAAVSGTHMFGVLTA